MCGGISMFRYWSWAAVLLIGFQVAGCYTDFGPVMVPIDPVPIAYTSTALHVGDRIKVTVYGEENLNGVYDVNPAGNVALPLAGSVRAAGRTTTELQREITRLYKSEYLQSPKVTVDIAILRPFFVMGEVKSPGEYAYQNGLNVINAVSAAGGLTYRGDRRHVLIQHAGEEVWNDYPLIPSIPVAPGDQIRVPERYF
jgi:protein involved in polysaccharide export with SLBB domain